MAPDPNQAAGGTLTKKDSVLPSFVYLLADGPDVMCKEVGAKQSGGGGEGTGVAAIIVKIIQ